MIILMPRPRPPYLNREKTRHGVVTWYVRKGAGPRIRIRGEYMSPEFMAAYQTAVNGEPAATPGDHAVRKAPTGTLAWLVDRYRTSSAWLELSRATRRQRENIFRGVLATAGQKPLASITRKSIVDGRERRMSTPAQANCFLKAMRGLYKWAAAADHVPSDPTIGVEMLRIRSEGHHVWTDEEVERFERRWPLGTRERVAFDVLLYTGLRRGDAVRLGRQHVRHGVFAIKTEKTGEEIVAPLLPILAATLAIGPTGDLAFIAGVRGLPMVKESFGTWFKKACQAAGVPGTAHGLRKAGATRAADNGATEAQLDAVFGWSGRRTAAIYTKKANRVRLARQAMGMLEKRTEDEHSIPAPSEKVRG